MDTTQLRRLTERRIAARNAATPNLKYFDVRCSCGHSEPRLMSEATAAQVVELRGALISEMPCHNCIKPENDPRNTAR